MLLSIAVGHFKPSSTSHPLSDRKQRLHKFYYNTDRRKHKREYKWMVTRMWHPQGCVVEGHSVPPSKASVSVMSSCKHMVYTCHSPQLPNQLLKVQPLSLYSVCHLPQMFAKAQDHRAACLTFLTIVHAPEALTHSRNKCRCLPMPCQSLGHRHQGMSSSCCKSLKFDARTCTCPSTFVSRQNGMRRLLQPSSHSRVEVSPCTLPIHCKLFWLAHVRSTIGFQND